MKARLLILTMFTAALMFFAPVQSNAQAIQFFDFFLFDNAGQPRENFNEFLQWTVTNGTVDLVGGTIPGVDEPPQGRFVDLKGASQTGGKFATRLDFPFLPDQTYNLAFKYKSTDGELGRARVTIGSQSYKFQTSDTNFQSMNLTFRFSELTVAKLEFQDSTKVYGGMGIDAVTLDANVAPTSANQSSSFIKAVDLKLTR